MVAALLILAEDLSTANKHCHSVSVPSVIAAAAAVAAAVVVKK